MDQFIYQLKKIKNNKSNIKSMSIINDYKEEFDKALEYFKSELGIIKTGRANPAILDGVRVEAYGTLSSLNQVASINVSDSRSLVIQPWDKNMLKVIEKGILESDLNVNPANDGEKIRINLPLLTEETRKETVKLLNHKVEEAKIAIRLIRDKVKEAIIEAEKSKEFGEDEKFRLLEELDKKVATLNSFIKELADKKEEEIMTI